jgi:hypothetical protein
MASLLVVVDGTAAGSTLDPAATPIEKSTLHGATA